MKQWHIYDKVFRRWVVYFIGSAEDLVEELKRSGFNQDTEWFMDAKGACLELTPENNSHGNNATVVWLKEYETSTLIHEISHLVMILFDQVSVPISRDNTETFAFYAEFWFTQFQRVRRNFPDGNKPKDARKHY